MRQRSKPSISRLGRVTAGIGVLGSFAALGVSPQTAHAAPTCLDFDSSGSTGVLTCEVPAGTTALRVVALGAGGGGAGGAGSNITSGSGGDGAKVTFDIAVTPGDVLTLEVGTGGATAGASNQAGAGGGGWTAVKNSGGVLLVVAAGGGGAGSDGGYFVSGVVVDGGDASEGGTAAGGSGASNVSRLEPGSGAAAGAGGLGGLCTANCAGPKYNGTDGGSGQGGNGGDALGGGVPQGASGWQGGSAGQGGSLGTGGGGGSGYFGGGGGAGEWFHLGAGGGAGSSYPDSGATYESAGNGGAVNAAGGDGSITLSAPPPPPTTTVPATTVPATTVPATTVPATTVPATTVPAPVPVDGVLPQLAPGTSQVLADGVPVDVEVVVEDQTDLILRGSGFELRLAGDCAAGCSIDKTPEGREVITLEESGRANVSGTGFMPNSPVYIWMFSDPQFLGELTTDGNGDFSGSVSIGLIPAGEHTLQVNGISPDGLLRTANLGVIVNETTSLLPATGSSGTPTLLLAVIVFVGGVTLLLARTARRP